MSCTAQMSCATARPIVLNERQSVKTIHASAIYVGLQQRNSGRQALRVKVQAALTAEAASLDVAKMAPLGDKLLVKPKAQDERSAGGVILSSSSGAGSMQDAVVGTVVAVGDEVDIGVVQGDMVLFTKYGTSDVDGPEGPVSFVAQKSILAKLS